MKKPRNEKAPFLKRHPLINKILAWCILISIAYVTYLCVNWIIHGLGSVLTWLKEFKRNTDAVIVVACITGAVSIFSVFTTAILGKWLDSRRERREYLAQKRETPYYEFVDMVYKIQQASATRNSYSQNEMIKDISKFSKELTLWGSPKVVDKWVQFREKAVNENAAIDNLFLLEEIMNEMRKDMGLPKTKKGNLLAFFVNDIRQAMKK